MEPEGSLLCSQVTTTCPYLDPDQSSTWAATYFSHIHLNVASMPFSFFFICLLKYYLMRSSTVVHKKSFSFGNSFGIYCPEIVNKIGCERHAFSFSTHVMGNLLTYLKQQGFSFFPVYSGVYQSLQYCKVAEPLSFPCSSSHCKNHLLNYLSC